jgi:hypothetical protein
MTPKKTPKVPKELYIGTLYLLKSGKNISIKGRKLRTIMKDPNPRIEAYSFPQLFMFVNIKKATVSPKTTDITTFQKKDK